MQTEIAMYLKAVEEGCEAVLRECAGVSAEALHWAPSPAANSLATIAKHSFANAERNLLMTFAGESYDWRRDQEFLARDETAESLGRAWARLQPRMRAALESIPESRLFTTLHHPRMGAVPGRAVLLQAVRHLSEHAGEAGLTRGLIDARKGDPD